MILRAILLLALPFAACPAFAAEAPKRVPPDRAAMSQSIATPLHPDAKGEARGVAPPARKAKRVRHTIPAPKRM